MARIGFHLPEDAFDPPTDKTPTNTRFYYYKDVWESHTDKKGLEYYDRLSGIGSVKQKIYLIGSLRNPSIEGIAKQLRAAGFDVFDDWYAIGPEADDHWKTYEQNRGRNFKQALDGQVCTNAFNFDKRNIDASDIGVMVMPAGKSGHTELGYMAGKGKRTYVLLEPDVDRWDIMYKFFTGVEYDVESLIKTLLDYKEIH
jgi:nucleoside 2-deoxyribosyltransferase